MATQIKIKIILGITLLTFFVFVLPYSSPIFSASEKSMSNLYANPNQSNEKNPYKFKVSDVVNSSLLTNVVGCTGVVNKVSTWMMKFVQSPAKQAEMMVEKVENFRAQLKASCASTKATVQATAGAIPTVNDLVTPITTAISKMKIKKIKACMDQVDSTDDKVLAAQIKQNQKDAEERYKEQCFDGIAITLAKNQLTAMTRSAVNWVNSGYGGNPFYVQNMNNFTNNQKKSLLTREVLSLIDQDKAYPFGSAFSKSIINGYKTNNSGNFLDSLTSDLSYFITSKDSYFAGGSEETAVERAKRANETFANDFSTGGWDGWIALTQRDQNNPLGFTMQASQYLEDLQAKNEETTKDELNRNSGFLDQKVCTRWQIFDNRGHPLKEPNPNYYLSGNGNFFSPGQSEVEMINVYRETKSSSGYDVCAPNGWKTLTPGGVIKEKTVSYLNSPERQLELADTINESLNALFSVLISKLEGSGLSGLSDSVVNNTNWEDTMNSYDDSSSPYNNNGAYGEFNLTRDLGNTFVHDKVYRAGKWNANSKINLTNENQNLIMGYVPPVYDKENTDDNVRNTISSNVYWEVTTSGDTKLIENGYNFWEVGDRAFWNGSEWQNWKCGQLSRGQCTNQISPIERRGVIQVQKDYIVAANEILKVLPNILSKMGELDYCLPGPNPNYQINSMDAQSAYQDWIGSIYVGQKDENRFGWNVDTESSRTYKNFASIFDDNSNVWKKIRTDYATMSWLLDNNPDGSFGNGGYEYNPNKNEMANLDGHRLWGEKIQNYVNNSLFQNFYESFDKIVNTLYFKSSTNKFLEKENTSILKSNPAYIEMAETGYGITKDITYYDNDISKVSQEYRDAISQSQINISKLEPIKAEVSKIILAAQARRDENLVKILNEETIRECNSIYSKCMSTGFGLTAQEASRLGERGQLCSAKKVSCEQKTITLAEYKTKYSQCLDEENIQVYDPDELLNTNYDTERCYNSLDDDLDGLIDNLDPDCIGSIIIPPGGGGGEIIDNGFCRIDPKIPPQPSADPENDPCASRPTKSDCLEEPYYHQNKESTCEWVSS